MKLAKNLDRLGTETAFSVLAEAKKLEAQGKRDDPLGFRSTRFQNSSTYYGCSKKSN